VHVHCAVHAVIACTEKLSNRNKKKEMDFREVGTKNTDTSTRHNGHLNFHFQQPASYSDDGDGINRSHSTFHPNCLYSESERIIYVHFQIEHDVLPIFVLGSEPRCLCRK
jgi:hypothetical protein